MDICQQYSVKYSIYFHFHHSLGLPEMEFPSLEFDHYSVEPEIMQLKNTGIILTSRSITMTLFKIIIIFYFFS